MQEKFLLIALKVIQVKLLIDQYFRLLICSIIREPAFVCDWLEIQILV